MPDLYDQIASGSYGRTRDRWTREPDFEEIADAVVEDEEDEIVFLDDDSFPEFDEE